MLSGNHVGEARGRQKKLYLEIKHFDLCRKVSVCHFSTNVKPGYTGPIQSIQSNPNILKQFSLHVFISNTY